MASSTASRHLLLLLFSILATFSTITIVHARPCKTIFFITTTTSSSHFLQKPNNNNNNNNFQLIRNTNLNNNNNSPRLTFFVTEIREFRRTRSLPRPMLFDQTITSTSTSDRLHQHHYYRERTMDIMSVAGAVLFGVGCGALTAATMYLFWSLFAPKRFEFESDSDETGDEENEVGPNAEDYFVVSDAAKCVPPSADEVDQAAVMKM